MNERVKELAEQAGASKLPGGELSFFGNDSIERFVQLIVAECMSVVTNLSPNYPLRYKNNLLIEIHHRDQIEEVFRGDCVEEIKQHFEIKE